MSNDAIALPMNPPPTDRLRQLCSAERDFRKSCGYSFTDDDAQIDCHFKFLGQHHLTHRLTSEELSWLKLGVLPCSNCNQHSYFDSRAALDGRVSRRCHSCSQMSKKENARVSSAVYRAKHRVDKEPQPCAHCGELFTPKRSTAKFCSSSCRVAVHRAKV